MASIVSRVSDVTIENVKGTKLDTTTVETFHIRGQFDATPAQIEALEALLRKITLNETVTIAEGELPGAASKTVRAAGTDRSAVRVWARENGHDVSDKGRISEDILSAYDKHMKRAAEAAAAPVKATPVVKGGRTS